MKQREVKSLTQNVNRVHVNDNTEQDIQKNVNKRQIVISVMRQRIIEEIRYGKRKEVDNEVCEDITELKIIKNVLI